MFKSSGTESSKQSPTFFKNYLSSSLHYILQSQTKIQFLLFQKPVIYALIIFIFFLFSKAREHLYLPSLQSKANHRRHKPGFPEFPASTLVPDP